MKHQALFSKKKKKKKKGNKQTLLCTIIARIFFYQIHVDTVDVSTNCSMCDKVCRDPDLMLRSAASDLGLRGLRIPVFSNRVNMVGAVFIKHYAFQSKMQHDPAYITSTWLTYDVLRVYSEGQQILICK